jgi:RHS repeat-associated protein
MSQSRLLPSGEVLAETDLTGTINEEYVYFGGVRIARVDRPTNLVTYFFSNHLGTASATAHADGTVTGQTDYYPFGGVAFSSGTDANHFRFTGKERDNETCNPGACLDYFGARHYSFTIGRFMTPDWAAKPTDVPYANFGNPQSLNLYSYTQNNPATFGDPDGHCCDWNDVVQTVGGVVNALNQNNGINTGSSLPENGLGRAIGDEISFAQGIGQMIGGSTMVVGGAGEALGTSPAAATGVGAVIPAAGVATAVAGGAIAADGAMVAGNAIKAMSGRAGDFRKSTRENAIKANSTENGGANKCEKCGQDVQRIANEKGKTPTGSIAGSS